MTKDICSRTIVDNYEQRVIIMIKNNEEIKNYIRRTYFSKLNDMLMIYQFNKIFLVEKGI